MNKTEERIAEALDRAGVRSSDPQYALLMDELAQIVRDSSTDESEHIYNSTLVGIVVRDDDEVIHINQYVIDMLGYTMEEYNRLSVDELIAESDREMIRDTLSKLDTGVYWNKGGVFRMIRKDGEIVWVKSHFVVESKPNGGRRMLVNLVNITELMSAKRSQESSNMIYRTLLESSIEGLEIIELASLEDPHAPHKILARNRAISRILQDPSKYYLCEEELSTLLPERQPDGRSSREHVRQNAMTLVEKGRVEFETEFLVNGERIISECQVEIFPVGDKRVLIRNYRDITDIRQKEQAILKQERVFETLVEALPGAVAIVDSQGHINYSSEHLKEIFAIPKNDIVQGKSLYKYVHQDDHAVLERLYRDAIDSERGVTRVIRGLKGDDVYHVELHARHYGTGSSDDSSVVIYIADVSERVEKEYDVFTRKKIYETLINNSFDAIDILTIEMDGYEMINPQLIVRNHKMVTLFGKDEPMVASEDICQLLGHAPEDFEKEYPVYMRNLLNKGYGKLSFSPIINGEQCYFDGKFLLVDVQGQKVLIRIITNTTDEVSHERALVERQHELEKYIESNLQLENFAYIASHDLKAPLRTVLSFSQLIKRSSYDRLDDRSQEFLDIVIDGANNMMRLIEDLLTYSRVNTKKVQIDKIKLIHLKESIMLDLTSVLDACGAKVTWELSSETISADKIKMTQIFENLIRNATKFIAEGVTPEIHIMERSDREYHYFTVSDNGIGIKADHFDKIFEVFSKLHSSDTYDGTGLGLSICARIVAQHGGRIWVESELGQGSAFHFTIAKKIDVI